MIPPSGPGLVTSLSVSPSLPEPPLYPEDKDRRCSVISGNMTKPITNFPLKNTKGARDKFGDIRRPSDLWQGRKNDDLLYALQSQFNASVVLGKDNCHLSTFKEYSREKRRNEHIINREKNKKWRSLKWRKTHNEWCSLIEVLEVPGYPPKSITLR